MAPAPSYKDAYTEHPIFHMSTGIKCVTHAFRNFSEKRYMLTAPLHMKTLWLRETGRNLLEVILEAIVEYDYGGNPTLLPKRCRIKNEMIFIYTDGHAHGQTVGTKFQTVINKTLAHWKWNLMQMRDDTSLQILILRKLTLSSTFRSDAITSYSNDFGDEDCDGLMQFADELCEDFLKDKESECQKSTAAVTISPKCDRFVSPMEALTYDWC